MILIGQYHIPILKLNNMTAVEWLVDQLKEFAFIPEHHIGMGDIRVSQGFR
jgi:hypothetical protein